MLLLLLPPPPLLLPLLLLLLLLPCLPCSVESMREHPPEPPEPSAPPPPRTNVQTIKQQLADGVSIRRVGFITTGAPARQGVEVRNVRCPKYRFWDRLFLLWV